MEKAEKQKKPLSQQKKVLLIVCVVVLLLVCALVYFIVNPVGRYYWYHTENGYGYLKYKNPVVHYLMDYDLPQLQNPDLVFESVGELQMAVVRGTLSDKTLRIFQDKTADENDESQIFDVFKLDNIGVPKGLSLSEIVFELSHFQIIYNNSDDIEVSLYTDHMDLFDDRLAAYENKKRADEWEDDKTKEYYTVEDGDHIYYVEENYDAKTQKIQGAYILYQNREYDVYFTITIYQNSTIPTDWITAFRYEPSFWEKLFS